MILLDEPILSRELSETEAILFPSFHPLVFHLSNSHYLRDVVQ